MMIKCIAVRNALFMYTCLQTSLNPYGWGSLFINKSVVRVNIYIIQKKSKSFSLVQSAIISMASSEIAQNQKARLPCKSLAT